MASCTECGTRPTNKSSDDKDDTTVIDLCPFNRMSDGRAFTDYRSRCQKVTSMTSYDERMFLMSNAENIISSTTKKFVCSSCATKSPDDKKSTMLPEKYKQVCNKNNCQFELNDENGVGVGR